MFAKRVRVCPVCKTPLTEGWKCDECKLAGLMAVWSFGGREGVLEKLVEEYKYQSVRAMGEVLAECADVAVSDGLGDEVVVVPLPTIGKHIRERGFDHTKTVARKLAKRRRWECWTLIGRAADTVQVGAKQAERETQARRAYEVVGSVETGRTYLLYDDVWTTGASMRAAAEALKAAGAEKVYGVVIAVSRPKADSEAGTTVRTE